MVGTDAAGMLGTAAPVMGGAFAARGLLRLEASGIVSPDGRLRASRLDFSTMA